jgi:uncharacterized membrane-anchored protein
MNTETQKCTEQAEIVPLIDSLAACLELQFSTQSHFIVDARISDYFDTECQACGNPASKVRLKTGKAAYMHSLLIKDGQAVRADYCRTPRQRMDFR